SRWVGLLGLFPLGLGLWRLIAAMGKASDQDAPATVAAGLSGVAGVAIINGADNITIYTPIFHSLKPGEALVMLAVFVAMIGVWCPPPACRAPHLPPITAIRRFSHRLVPIILIAIGAIILTRSAIG